MKMPISPSDLYDLRRTAATDA
jgi:hypothetical protein